MLTAKKITPKRMHYAHIDDKDELCIRAMTPIEFAAYLREVLLSVDRERDFRADQLEIINYWTAFRHEVKYAK
jgi:hypothetical protein